MKVPQLELDRQLAAAVRALLGAGSAAVRPQNTRRPLGEWTDFGPEPTQPRGTQGPQ